MVFNNCLDVNYFLILGSKFRAYARNEVIVSAGSVMSPHLLMLSGIGPKQHLKKHGVREQF